MKNTIVLILFTLIIGSVFGQEDKDTIPKDIQNYKEIVIQGKSKSEKGALSPKQGSIDNLLSQLPSITMIKRGNYALEPTIRGLNAGQINLTIDGMQMFGACTDKMDAISSYIEPTNLEKIELNTTLNEEQTSSTVGGGVNFKLLKAQLGAPKKISGNLGAGYETNANYKHTLGKFQYSTKRWAVLVNGIYRKADNYYAAKREEIKFSQFEKWNVATNLAFLLNENSRLYFDYIQDEGYDIGYPALTMDVAFAKAYISSFTHEYQSNSRLLRSLETKFFFNFIDHAMDDTKRPIEQVPIHMDMPGTSKTFGGYSKATLRLADRHILTLNFNAFQNELHSEMTMYPENGSEMFMLTIPDARRRMFGLTVSDKWIVNNNLKVLIGGRIESNSFNVTTNMGRQTLTSFYSGNPKQESIVGNIFAQLDYKLSENWMLYGGSSYAQRTANLQELYGFYLFNRQDNHDYIGNPNLENEASINTNIGVRMGTKKVALSIEGFANSFSNYIVGIKKNEFSGMANGSDGVKQYNNIPSALLIGAEFTLRYEPIKNLSFESVNSYTHGTDNENKFLPYIPPFKSMNILGYTLKDYTIRLEYIAALAQNNVSTARYGERSTPAFSLINLMVQKHFELNKQRGIHAELGVENLLDASYYEHLDVMKIKRQGRNFMMRATFMF